MAAKKTTKKVPGALGAKIYNTFGGLSTARTRGTLPRGVKVTVGDGLVDFHDGKGVKIASLSLVEFAKGELKRHGFALAKGSVHAPILVRSHLLPETAPEEPAILPLSGGLCFDVG